MTALDDALDSSSVVLGPAKIHAEWPELMPNYSPGQLATDDVRDLGQQIGPEGYTVEHSLDDGLPDPVTMTSANDASGQMTAELTGRNGAFADVAGFRGAMAGASGTGTTINIAPFPVSSAFHDYVVVGVVIIGMGVTFTTNQDDDDPHRWRLLGHSQDGSVGLYAFGIRKYPGSPNLVLTLSASSSWVWTGNSIYTQTHGNVSAVIPARPGTVVTAQETVNQEPHTIPNVRLNRRGWIVSFWATIISIGWSPQGDLIKLYENASNPRLMMARTPLRNANWKETLLANTFAPTDSVAMIAVPIEIIDRPAMDAMQYFSPFNRDSPIYGYERDVAPVTLDQPVITEEGPVDTTLFTGQMAAIPLKGRLAEVQALSKTRVTLDRLLTLPVVYGHRAGCTVDWLATWVMARGGQYAGPSCSQYTRLWVPFYGSIQASLDSGPRNFANGNRYTIDNPGFPDLYRPPIEIPGPFVSGMFAKYTNEEVLELNYIADRAGITGGPTELGFDTLPLAANDMMSQTSSKGRVTFWLRGDDTDPSSAATAGAPAFTNTLFRYRLNSIDKDSVVLTSFEIRLREDRRIELSMGSAAAGYFTGVLADSELPNDGEWHFYSVCFDWDANEVSARLDNTTWDPTPGWATTPTASLFSTERALRNAGGYIDQEVWARVPISDFQVEAGPEVYAEGTAGRFWPSLSGSGGNATYRRTGQWIQAIADTTPVQGWQVLADLAQATLSHYRVNELDNFEFLPLQYFGEADQLTPTIVADTEVNASELNITMDPSKMRNVVTMEFPDTRVDTTYSRIMTITSTIELRRGVFDATFPVDEPIAEINGLFAPYSSAWNITKLTSAQIATPTLIPANTHFMTVNTRPDGAGSVYTGPSVTARVLNWDSSGVTIRFTNSTFSTVYLVNNGEDVPFLSIAGKAIRTNTSFTTHRDAGIIGSARGERPLTASSHWIQDRETAIEVAGKLVTMLARPRAEVVVEVMGDPRRVPGQMVELADSQGTHAEGTWRILSVKHNGSGAQFTQTLQLVLVHPPGVWDSDTVGWDNSVWVE